MACVHIHGVGDGVQFVPADKHYWKHDAYILMPSRDFPVEMFIYGGPESMPIDEGVCHVHVAPCALQHCLRRTLLNCSAKTINGLSASHSSHDLQALKISTLNVVVFPSLLIAWLCMSIGTSL